MGKKWIGGIVAAIVVAAAVFLVWRSVNGSITVNGAVIRNDEDISDTVSEYFWNNGQYYFTDSSLEEAFVSYTLDLDEVLSRGALKKFWDNIVSASYTVQCGAEVDFDALKAYVEEHNASAAKSVDAYITKENGKWEIVDEVYGDEINYKKVKKNLKSGSPLDLENYYIQPKVTAKDLENTLTELEAYTSWEVTYINGESVRASIDFISLDENGEIVTDNSFIGSQYEGAVSSFHTVGGARVFHTTGGQDVTVSGGTWGEAVDYAAELAELQTMFAEHKTEDARTPIYAYQYDEIGNSYLEVSISAQHLWHYVNGQLCCETDIVTGKPGNDTPCGTYFISERINGKYLVGEGYKTWVNKWMRLTNQGVGLHDAKWRSSFGGTIYVRRGSHGCINLPASFAYNLFDEVSVGYPVIIY